MKRNALPGVLATVIGLATSLMVIPAPVSSAAGTWSAARSVSAANVSASRPSVSMSGDGSRIVMSWQGDVGANTVIQTSYSDDKGTTWSAPTTASSANLDWASSKVVISQDGSHAFTIFRSDIGSPSVVKVAASSNGGASWAAPVSLSTIGVSSSGPQIVTSSDGMQVTAMWYATIGASTAIQTSSSADGGATWTGVKTLTEAGSDNDFNYVRPLVASTDGKNVLIAWDATIGALHKVYVARTTDGGVTWSSPILVSSVLGGGSYSSIAASADGSTALVAYSQLVNGKFLTTANVSTDFGATWSAPTTISSSTNDAVSQSVTLSADGKVSTCAWVDEADNSVKAATSSTSGVSWSAPVAIVGPAVGVPYLASSSDGSRVTAITDVANAGKYDVYVTTTANSGASWGQPVRLSTVGQDASELRISSSLSGGLFAATWAETAGAGKEAKTSILNDPTVALAPTGVAVSPSDTSASITFTAPKDNGGSAITNYEYSFDAGATWSAIAPATAASPVKITGLTQTTKYGLQLRAVNAQGSGAATSRVEFTTLTKQVAKKSPKWAKKIAPRSWVKLAKIPITTNAKQKANISVVAKIAGTKKSATKKQFKKKNKNGYLQVWSSGKKKLRVSVTAAAPAVPSFTAYSVTKKYTVKKGK